MAIAENAQLLLSIDASVEILRSEIAKGSTIVDKFAAQTERDSERVRHSFEKMGEKARETAIKFGELGAAILIGESIKGAIEKAIEYSETLVKTGQQLGVTTKFLQEFRFAAQQSAVSSESADVALGRFSVSLGRAADGNKKYAEAFSNLGVKIADVNGNLRPTEAVFRDTADAISKISGPAQQAAATYDIFGRGGQALIPILKAGADGFNKFGAEAEKAGLILADNTIEHLEELSNATKKVKQEISVTLAKVVGDNAEALLKLGRGAADAAGYLGTLFDRLRGLSYLSANGGVSGVLQGLRGGPDFLQKAGTKQGQLDYQKQQLAEQQQVVANLPTGLGAIYDKIAGNQQAELKRRKEAVQVAQDALLTYNNPVGRFLPKEGDLGASGGKVTLPDDKSGQRAADKAAAEAARAQNEADRIAAAAEARLVSLRKEVEGLDASITEGQARLAATPELRLAADIAGEQARTNALVAKQKLDAGNDTTKDQRDVRTRAIADLKTLGNDRIAIIRDQYAREHAAALQSINDGNTQIELSNRAANAALIKDDDDRAEAEKSIASDSVDFQIAQIERRITAEAKTLGKPEIAALRKQQADLAAGKGAQLASIDRANQGSLQGYLDSLPTTAGKANVAFQNAAVDGLRAFDDGITGAILHTKSLGQAFSEVTKTIIADLLKIAVEKEVVGPLAGLLGLGGSGGGGGGGFLASLFGGGGGDPFSSLLSANSGISIPTSGFGFAGGGSPPVGKASLVGERGPEMFIPRVPGIIIPNGGGGASSVAVHVTTEPSPLFTQVVTSAVQRGNAEAVTTSRNDLRLATRQRMPGSR